MYYSDTAFDSSNPVVQKPATKKLSFAQESAKTHALKGRGLHCQEYCAMQDMDMLDYLKRVGDIPLNKIADTFKLSHTGSVSRIIHDAKIIIADELLISNVKVIEKKLLVYIIGLTPFFPSITVPEFNP